MERRSEVTITRNRIFIYKLFTLSTADKNWLNSGKDLVAICEEITLDEFLKKKGVPYIWMKAGIFE